MYVRGSGKYANPSQSVHIEEESVTKEATFVESVFEENTPADHHSISLLVKGISKYFFKG